MTDTFIIEPGEKLPGVEELIQILRIHERVAIRYAGLTEEYISTLTYSLPDKAVYDRQWDKTIFISPCFHNEKILQKKVELYKCAEAFRRDANYLMQLMSETFGIDLQTLNGLHELKRKSHKQRGKLTAEWNYYLHGAECQFENTKTNQIVEVIVITKPEFGYLDCYFFYRYMATTDQFKNLAEFFDYDHKNICKALDLLVLEKVLTRMHHPFVQRNIIAL